VFSENDETLSAKVEALSLPRLRRPAQPVKPVEVQLTADSVNTALPHIQSGKVRALGVASSKRSPALPDVPTFDESGMPGFEVSQWWAILVPRGTPNDVVTKLHTEISAIVKNAEMKGRMAELGVDPVGGTPEQLGELVRSEIAKFRKIVADAKITLN
jgi:tripartite-type tricarboxylate transporter receptor subunit TctC